MIPTKKSHGDSPNLVRACMHSRMTALLASEVLASHGDVRLKCLCTEKSVILTHLHICQFVRCVKTTHALTIYIYCYIYLCFHGLRHENIFTTKLSKSMAPIVFVDHLMHSTFKVHIGINLCMLEHCGASLSKLIQE